MSEQSPREQAAKAVRSTLNGLIPGAAGGPTTVEVVHERDAYGRSSRNSWSSDAHGFAERVALTLDVAVLQPLLARITELEGQRTALADRLRAGQTWQQGRTAPMVSQDYVSQDELRTIFGIPLTAPWDDADDSETFVPRTERAYWVDIAAALNAAQVAGMPVGIDLDGTLTDRHMWSVVWDLLTKRWTVAGYESTDKNKAAPVTLSATRAEAAPTDEYLYCGADLGRSEYPFCERRVAHDGPCAPERDPDGGN